MRGEAKDVFDAKDVPIRLQTPQFTSALKMGPAVRIVSEGVHTSRDAYLFRLHIQSPHSRCEITTRQAHVHGKHQIPPFSGLFAYHSPRGQFCISCPSKKLILCNKNNAPVVGQGPPADPVVSPIGGGGVDETWLFCCGHYASIQTQVPFNLEIAKFPKKEKKRLSWKCTPGAIAGVPGARPEASCGGPGGIGGKKDGDSLWRAGPHLKMIAAMRRSFGDILSCSAAETCLQRLPRLVHEDTAGCIGSPGRRLCCIPKRDEVERPPLPPTGMHCNGRDLKRGPRSG